MDPVDLQWERPRAAVLRLLTDASSRLSDLLGPGWKVDQHSLGADGSDAMWHVRPPAGPEVATMVVEPRVRGMTPRMAEQVAHGLDRARRRLGVPDAARLVSAPYLSPRAREALERLGLGYVDVTGNVSLRLDAPLVVLRTEGAQRDPSPRQGGRRGMSGPRAGRLVRELVDRHPPRRGTELAHSAGLSEGYVSRLLELFTEEAFVGRRQRVVTEIDWPALLRARASTYELMQVNKVLPTVAPRGLGDTMSRLRELTPDGRDTGPVPVLATGAFAANEFAPLVAGGALLLYVRPSADAAEAIRKQLGLMRVEQQASADVLLLQPTDDSVFDRPHRRPVDGVRVAGLSQVALDCLAGPGRLPAAGEELVSWMALNDVAWRAPSPLADSSR